MAVVAACAQPSPAVPERPPTSVGLSLKSRVACTPAPCFEERWAAPDTEARLVIRRRKVEGPQGRWRRRWPFIAGLLELCLGDPLGDPAVHGRTLVQTGDAHHWWLRPDGQGSCGLGGELTLDAHDNTVDLGALTVEGIPWSEGGQQRARSSLRVWMQAEARQTDSVLTEEQRAWLEADLSRPHGPRAPENTAP